MMKAWIFIHEHSLTLAFAALGVAAIGCACWIVWPLEPDRWFDLLSGLGLGALIIAAYNGLAGRLKEVNRPEQEPA